MITRIYVLTEPNGGRIRYVGKTVRSLSARLTSHLCRARTGEKSHLFHWLRLILSNGFLPSIFLVGEVEQGNGSKEEIAWIKYFRDEGVDLVNSTDGGEGFLGYIFPKGCHSRLGKHHSLETRKKMSEVAHQRMTPKMRKQISDKLKGEKNINYGKPRTEEIKRKISEANKGQTRSDDFCRRMSESRKGIRLSLEHCRKISEGNIGKRLGYHASLETRRKSSESHKGKPNGCLGTHRSPESRLKMSLAKKGKHWTEEHRRKILENNQRRKQNEVKI